MGDGEGLSRAHLRIAGQVPGRGLPVRDDGRGRGPELKRLGSQSGPMGAWRVVAEGATPAVTGLVAWCRDGPTTRARLRRRCRLGVAAPRNRLGSTWHDDARRIGQHADAGGGRDRRQGPWADSNSPGPGSTCRPGPFSRPGVLRPLDRRGPSDWRPGGPWANSYGASLDDPDGRGRVVELSAPVKAQAASLAMTSDQRDALAAVRDEFADGALAVRSSSPEEDLAAASFAGLYESGPRCRCGRSRRRRAAVLPVLPRRPRLFTYKLNMGFADPAPSIAVVVQRMVPSETSGVAFSLNPLTNDYDEMLVNAHRGLGEALVAGEITPGCLRGGQGHGCRDRRASVVACGTRVPRRRGTGRVVVRRRTDRVALYGRPMDVEWAFADGPDGGRLHILQSASDHRLRATRG